MKEYTCDVEKALDLLAGKWGTLIIRELLKEPKRHSELKKSIDGINLKTLTVKLRHLEKHHIIDREVFAEVPPKVIYSITEYGKKIKPIIEALRIWGGSEPPSVTIYS